MAVGDRLPRADARAKVTGSACYVDDVTRPGMLHGVTVRSTIARGRILSIDFDPEFDWTRVVVVDHRDIPGRNVVSVLIDDQPVLVEREIRHRHEPILLIAAETPQMARAAAQAVTVNCERKPGIVGMDQALAARHVLYEGGPESGGAPNVFKEIRILKGDPKAVFESATRVIEEIYTTSWQEQLYIEPQGMLAEIDNAGNVQVLGSMQCPYYVHKALKVALGRTHDHEVRVVQAETGGGFGGKEEYPSIVAIHAALLALKSGRPVKLIYDRHEDLAATTKRHPSEVVHRTAIDENGHLLAAAIDILLDGGAYATLSPVVLSRAALHALSAYRCDHVDINARVVATNTPPNGAFRGFGAPQTIFACEKHMDLIAAQLGISPLEIRRRNVLRPGDTTTTGQVLDDAEALLRVLEDAALAADFTSRWERYNRREDRSVWRGIGISLFMHGNGFTGSGEKKLAGRLTLQLVPDSRRCAGVVARILTASTEIGQGMRTVFAQIAAETLGIPFDHIEIPPQDTWEVPDSGPTVASRTCMVVGGLVEQAGRRLLEHLPGKSTDRLADRVAAGLKTNCPLEITLTHVPPAGVEWNDDEYRGAAYASFGYGCDIVAVKVDPTTLEVAIDDVIVCHDVGRAVNPAIVEGQIEGGTAQGLGFAWCEEVSFKDGGMSNATMTDYIIPTAADLPRIRVLLRETPYAFGPFGAKGVGEMPIDGAAPPLVAAIEQATGQRFNDLPVTPERIAAALMNESGDRRS